MGRPCDEIRFGEPFAFRMLWNHGKAIPGAYYAIRVSDDQDRLLFAVNTLSTVLMIESRGLHDVICQVTTNVLVPGEYYAALGCYIRPHTLISVLDPCLKLVVVNVPYRTSKVFNIVGNPAFAIQPAWEQR